MQHHTVQGCNKCPFMSCSYMDSYCVHPGIIETPYQERQLKEDDDLDLINPDWCLLKKEPIKIKLSKKLCTSMK
jgi:hypothetical protein